MMTSSRYISIPLCLVLGFLSTSASALSYRKTPSPLAEEMTATEQLYACKNVTKTLIKAALKESPEIAAEISDKQVCLKTPLTFWEQHITVASLHFNDTESEVQWDYISTLPFTTLRTKLGLNPEQCIAPGLCSVCVGEGQIGIYESPTDTGLQVECSLKYQGEF